MSWGKYHSLTGGKCPGGKCPGGKCPVPVLKNSYFIGNWPFWKSDKDLPTVSNRFYTSNTALFRMCSAKIFSLGKENIQLEILCLFHNANQSVGLLQIRILTTSSRNSDAIACIDFSVRQSSDS